MKRNVSFLISVLAALQAASPNYQPRWVTLDMPEVPWTHPLRGITTTSLDRFCVAWDEDGQILSEVHGYGTGFSSLMNHAVVYARQTGKLVYIGNAFGTIAAYWYDDPHGQLQHSDLSQSRPEIWEPHVRLSAVWNGEPHDLVVPAIGQCALSQRPATMEQCTCCRRWLDRKEQFDHPFYCEASQGTEVETLDVCRDCLAEGYDMIAREA